jgi:DNA-binding response OmpR family regulator
MKILLVEDDESLITVLTHSLTAHHFVVDVARDGEAGWAYSSTFEYDLIVLDIVLPKLNGLRLCQHLRAEGLTTPILLLTAQNTSTTKVKGLNAGADDCVIKPFDLAELIARIRALLRRGKASPAPILTWGALHLNPDTCEVTYDGQPLSLTTKEYDLLELLLRDRHHVLSIDEILDRLWSSEDFPAEATVRSHIRRLRHKLSGRGAPPDLISTLHGRGYYLKLPTEPPTPSTLPPTFAAAPPPLSAEQQQAQYLAFLNQTWATTRPQCLERLTLLYQTIAEIQHDRCGAAQRQAQQMAHQLAGTLGMFGFARAMHSLRQLEDWLHHPSPPTGMDMSSLLDALQRELQSTPSIQTLPSTDRLPTPLTPAKVLIVDDDPIWLQTLPELLQPWGFEVTPLNDPHQLWPVLQTIDPDILVLDINLPQINGFELCQQLRSDPHWQRLPIVFLSGLSDPIIQNHAFTIGADDYLCKPVAGIDLANRILNRLQRVRAWAS